MNIKIERIELVFGQAVDQPDVSEFDSENEFIKYLEKEVPELTKEQHQAILENEETTFQNNKFVQSGGCAYLGNFIYRIGVRSTNLT